MSTQPQPQPFNADLELALFEAEQQSSSLLIESKEFRITDQATMSLVGERLLSVVAMRKHITQLHSEPVLMAQRSLDAAKALRDSMLKPVEEAERLLKGKVQEYTNEQQRARREAEEAQQKQAKEAQDRIRDQQLKVTREQAQREADRRIKEATTDEQLLAAVEEQESTVNEAVEVAKAKPMPIVTVSSSAVVPTAKVKGVGVSYTYKAMVFDIRLLCAEVGSGKASIELVTANMTALNKLAKVYKEDPDGHMPPGTASQRSEGTVIVRTN